MFLMNILSLTIGLIGLQEGLNWLVQNVDVWNNWLTITIYNFNELKSLSFENFPLYIKFEF